MASETLSDIALITPGTSPKGELINSEGLGLPFFQGSKEFQAFYPRAERFTEFPVKVAKKDDILISVRAPVGQVNLAPQDVAIGRGVMSVRPKQDSDRFFIFYLLKWLEGRWDSLGSTGSVFENLSVSALSAVEIPKVEHRELIGRVLFQLDCKIQENTRISKTLESMSQTIFKSWFIDFGPVKAKMSGEMPVGMDDATAALFPDSMEDSELGPIPKGWGYLSASEIFEVGIGRTPPRKESKWFCDGGNGVDWVSIRDMGTYGVFADGTNEGLTEEAVHKFRVPIVPKQTVLMSFKLTVGKLCITDRELVTNEAIAHFKVTSKSSIGSIFAYLWLANQNMASLDSTSSIGTATNSAIVKAMKFLVPSEKVHSAFVNVVGEMFAEIENLTEQTNQLVEIRDAMLPRLISGELQIPEEMLVS